MTKETYLKAFHIEQIQKSLRRDQKEYDDEIDKMQCTYSPENLETLVSAFKHARRIIKQGYEDMIEELERKFQKL